MSLVLAHPDDPHLGALLELAADPLTAVVAVITAPYGDLPRLTISTDTLLLPEPPAAVNVARRTMYPLSGGFARDGRRFTVMCRIGRPCSPARGCPCAAVQAG